MLETLGSASNPAKLEPNDDFQRDLAWFDHFLPLYNSISMHAHKNSNSVLELNACLTGLGVDGTILFTTSPLLGASEALALFILR